MNSESIKTWIASRNLSGERRKPLMIRSPSLYVAAKILMMPMRHNKMYSQQQASIRFTIPLLLLFIGFLVFRYSSSFIYTLLPCEPVFRRVVFLPDIAYAKLPVIFCICFPACYLPVAQAISLSFRDALFSPLFFPYGYIHVNTS